MKIFATHGVSIESIELFSVACAQEKHYVLGKRPNNFCSSRKYSSANTLLKQTRNKEEQKQQTTNKQEHWVVLHYVLGKRPNNFCSSRKYSLANTLLKQTRNKEEQQQQTRALSCFASCAWETTKQKEEKKISTFPDQGRN